MEPLNSSKLMQYHARTARISCEVRQKATATVPSIFILTRLIQKMLRPVYASLTRERLIAEARINKDSVMIMMFDTI